MNPQLNALYVVARVLVAQIFVIAGVRKLFGYAGTIGYFKALGVPMPEVVVPLSIALELGGGILLALGVKTRIVAVALCLFTIGTALIGHQFWAADTAQFNGQLNNFLKNVAMAGGFLMMLLFDWQQRANAKATF